MKGKFSFLMILTAIEEKIVRFICGNTHLFVHVEAPDEDGQMQVWAE